MKNDSNHLFAIGSKVQSIELVQEPDKTRYDAGEMFDPTGMKVVAHMANGAEKDITNSKLLTWADTPLEGRDISVQLTYSLRNSSLTVLVPVVVITDAEHEAQRKAIDAIQAIGEVTLEKEEQIREARELYDAVIPTLQEEIKDSLVILETAEKKLAELIAERDAVREAEALVDRIAEPVTLESEEIISAARTAYNGLTVRQKEMYSPDRLTRLEALEAALAEKKKQAAEDAAREEENREKIAAVETLIDAIGTVTKNSGPSITAARTAFDALSETLRARVGNYNVLLCSGSGIQTHSHQRRPPNAGRRRRDPWQHHHRREHGRRRHDGRRRDRNHRHDRDKPGRRDRRRYAGERNDRHGCLRQDRRQDRDRRHPQREYGGYRFRLRPQLALVGDPAGALRRCRALAGARQKHEGDEDEE